jgi:hypothetical protein
MNRKPLLAIGIAALALAAAGCGGSDESSSTTDVAPASEWADGFCTAVTTWKDDVTTIKNDFGLDDLSEDGLQAAADDLKASTQTLVDDLKALGAPDTESGEEVKASIDDLASTLETEMSAIEQTVDEASGLTELPGAATDVLGSLEEMAGAFQSTLSTIGDADVQNELEDALQSSTSCEGIVG